MDQKYTNDETINQRKMLLFVNAILQVKDIYYPSHVLVELDNKTYQFYLGDNF
ncbi:hypothetical protein VQL36_04970 [Chengkuizengella sp. SCS-71B]|uniref:hypothetical protein n=1 Tax=Chengkuizengella sp. SCS-71B TaxID=3115290 RepID=UPI0032C23BAD